MIPTTKVSNPAPLPQGQIAFHVVVDNTARTFTMDGPDGPNGIRLQFDAQQDARRLQRKFLEFDMRSDSQENALAEMWRSFPGYEFFGTWAKANSNRDILLEGLIT